MQRGWQIALLAGFLVWVFVGCSAETTPTPTLQPAADPVADGSQPGTISAAGITVPAEWTALSFSLLGTVDVILVESGQPVRAGDVLARLDTLELEAALAQAEAAVAQAQANLDRVNAGPAAEEIEAARWAVVAAQARVAAAVAQKNALYSGVTEADIAAAQSQLIQAQLQFEDASDQMERVLDTDPADCETLQQAEIPDTIDTGGLSPEAIDFLAAQFGVTIPPEITMGSSEDLDILVEQQRASACPLGQYEKVYAYYTLADLGVQASQAYLDALLAGPSAELIAIENARIWAASAQVETAQARLDYLEAQPFPTAVTIAEAELEQARAGASAVRAALDLAVLRAPFDGTITDVMLAVGELAAPGQPAFILADLSTLRIETTDLTESEVVLIAENDAVRVTFDALPGIVSEGIVMAISPRVSDGPGVNYTAMVTLKAIPDGLRWGMTASIEIQPAAVAARD
jgi:multidrug efflux pump subunit AcrA (membrane-fusion protein)